MLFRRGGASERGPRWAELLRSLHQSFFGVIRAELEALSHDLASSGKSLGLALVYFFFAAGLALFAVGALAFAGVASLMLVMPAWAAGLLIAVLLLGGAGFCGWVGARRLGQVEGPAAAARRRFQGHSEWWQDRVTGAAVTGPAVGLEDDEGAGEETP